MTSLKGKIEGKILDYTLCCTILLCLKGIVIIYNKVDFSRWAEQDPMDILNSVTACIDKAVENLKAFDKDPACIKGNLYKDLTKQSI